jgi:CheY-like chemotaxis protein
MLPRILIVDDEGDFIELVKFRLANLGCEFLVAADGVHALSQAREGKPDLILLDILLPDLDGLSVCEILRRQPNTKKIPMGSKNLRYFMHRLPLCGGTGGL